MTKIALFGSPNCGKTTLFNLLTGARQKVGNWPGVTVERKSGFRKLGAVEAEFIDLPGVYSLDQEYQGVDEKIARDFLDTGEADLLINVIDASNLERSLVLTQQLMERKLPLLLVMNMLDVAEQQGVSIDTGGLSERLGVTIVPMVASRGSGLDQLIQRIQQAAAQPVPSAGASDGVAAAETALPAREQSINETLEDATLRRYHHSRRLVDGVVEVIPGVDTLSERIDRVVLNRVLGVPIFLLMIYLMFTVAVNLGAVFIDFFDILFAAVLVDGVGWALEQLGTPALIVTLLAQGVGGGITLVATFILVIGFLYLCLSILEDSGYMSRAAFVIDRLMSSIGLPGTAFVPLIVGFGCNVPAVMAARTLGRDSDRLLTISMAPFMSCGARLTVYALFAAAFFQSSGQNIVFGLYLLGIALAVFTGWIFRRQLFVDDIAPSFQEMPAYHLPVARNILLTTWFRLKGFIVRAGRTIVSVVIVLSLLNSISTDGSFGNEDSEQSMLSVIGKSITPVFAPMGIQADNWPATVGLFTGMFAKEAIVGTLDALYSEPEADSAAGAPDLLAAVGDAVGSIGSELLALGDTLTDPLGISIGDVSDTAAVAEEQGVQNSTLTNMASLFGSPFAAFCYLVFVLLYAPCVAVLGAVAKEAGLRWTALIFGWSTGLAYIAATVTYQIGSFTAHPLSSALWIAGMLTLLALFIVNLKHLAPKMQPKNLIPAVQV
jgi:ferrous iron transport protein B